MLQIKSLTQLQLYQQYQVQGNHFIFVSKIITIQTIQHNIKISTYQFSMSCQSLYFNTVYISLKFKDSLTCIICFYFYSRVLIGSTFDFIGKSEQRSLIYGETLMMLVYLYRNIKYVLFLSKLTLENVL
ncbi:Hypothetical_protein [Hexamita inflata]|uniref:Hypothetical_protein n=1 Tax=Hexamita inflata TaxID=28002 RepID=A0AA86N6W6_9EUKA|nr:Hypothetical protein HINF_LOCUS1219 [Hexamita inflata]